MKISPPPGPVMPSEVSPPPLWQHSGMSSSSTTRQNVS
jgi:hypothetical protein